MPRITGYSPELLEEHLNLARKHFPSREAIAANGTNTRPMREELAFTVIRSGYAQRAEGLAWANTCVVIAAILKELG